MTRLLTAAALLAVVPAARAASTAAWEMNTYQDFLKGRFTGLSLSRTGKLLLGPKLETLFASDQPVVWSLAQAPDGSLYLGTGHRGQVFRVDPSGKSETVWSAEQPEVFAVALDARGRLYAATSPNGKVYRIENGQASEYFAPGARYIWALAFSRDGALYVATGDDGKIFRVTGPGQGEIYYETGQSHVTALAVDRDGRLLAGTEPNGILYRVSAKDKAFVLHDADLPEIRAIVAASDGTIYAAALGGSVARQTAAAAPAAMMAPATTLTVTATAPATGVATPVQGGPVQSGIDIKPKPQPGALPAAAAIAPLAPALEVTGMEKSALYRIHPDNMVETVWRSKEENAYDLVADGARILIATDGKGRVYQLDPDRQVTLLAQTNESEATRLVSSRRGMLVATGNMGRLYRLADGTADAGSYESPPHDAGRVARWGRLSWRGEPCAGCRLALRTRSGNSARPDKTWSEWSQPLEDAAGSAVPSPNARYIQWTAEFTGAGGRSPELNAVRLAYLPQNSPPAVRNITVTSQVAAAQATRPPAAFAPATVYSITVTDTGEPGASSAGGTATQTLARAASAQLQITWQAEDLDGDRLDAAVHFRGEGEREWKPLKLNPSETTLTLDTEAFADGKYYFRVRVSDRPSNPPPAAREAELISAPVLIDQTPPSVAAGAPRRSGAATEVDVEAVDGASPLVRCEYSLDAAPWVPVDAADGVTDSPRERFLVRLEAPSAGEHLLVIRVYDAAGNPGLAKVLLR